MNTPNILDINYFHSLPRSPSGLFGEWLLIENAKYKFFLPITNNGGFSHEWYNLLLRYPETATRLKQFLDSLDNLDQWMYKAIKFSVSYAFSEDFVFEVDLIHPILDSMIIKDK